MDMNDISGALVVTIAGVFRTPCSKRPQALSAVLKSNKITCIYKVHVRACQKTVAVDFTIVNRKIFLILIDYDFTAFLVTMLFQCLWTEAANTSTRMRFQTKSRPCRPA